MKRRLLALTFFLNGLAVFSIAQPALTPAPGYSWQPVSTNTYTTGPQRTGCKTGSGSCGTNDSSFGLDVQCPPDLPSTTVSGCSYVQKQIFGNYGTSTNPDGLALANNPGCDGTSPNSNWPSSSLSARRINLTEWTNPNPASALANGATSGMVCIPTAARIIIDDGSPCDGSGVGADELRFLVIGGNSGQQSNFNITANYQLHWSSSNYGGSGTTGPQTITQNLVVNDAGNGNSYDWALQQTNKSWYFPSPGNNVASFGTSLQQTFNVPVGSINQAGGSFFINFTATASIDVTRAPGGNADARVTMGPGFHGRARYVVDYQCWQIVANPLPVRLVSFTGKAGDGMVNLQWETASEQDNSHFDIERSADAKGFEAIGREAGKGTTSAIQHYLFVDKSPLTGVNYYRLRQVDTDGRTTYSKITAVVYDSNQPLLELVGNPTDNQSIRVLAKNVSLENLKLTSLTGQPISFDLQSEDGVIYRLTPKTTLASGAYVLVLRDDKTRLSQRLVIK